MTTPPLNHCKICKSEPVVTDTAVGNIECPNCKLPVYGVLSACAQTWNEDNPIVKDSLTTEVSPTSAIN